MKIAPKKTCTLWASLALLATLVAACKDGDAMWGDDVTTQVPINLSMNISTVTPSEGDTRLSDQVTQIAEGVTARNVQDFHIIPYRVKGTITANDDPLLGQPSGLNRVTNTTYHYYGTPYEVTTGTASFLCYCRAIPLGDASQRTNGSITTPNLDVRMSTGDIYFAPTPIYDENNVAADDALNIATALNTIAHAHTTSGSIYEWRDTNNSHLKILFDAFTNKDEHGENHLMAASSANVKALVEELQTAVGKLNTAGWTETDKELTTAILKAIDESKILSASGFPAGFPASIGLPDGAAVVRWNGSNFVTQTEATTMAMMVSQNRYCYPAELYFYTNSQINTSNKEIKSSDYENKDWTDVLELYENKNASVNGNTRAVAIREPLRYGVGSLKATVTAESTVLKDADGTSITLTSTSFPLKGLLISGQYKQGFDFKPTDDINEYVLYDSQIPTDTYLALPSGTARTFTTLTFQSKEESTPIKVVLEFENNSGVKFRGVNGLVYPDTKFYLIGELTPLANPDPTKDYEKRVFTQGYTTQATLKVPGLAKAYNVIPDLWSARLEVGVEVKTDWILSTTSNAILK